MRTHTRPYATNQNRRQCDRGLRAAQILARQPRRGGHRHSGTDSADLGCHGDRQEFYEWNRRAFDLDRRFAAHTVAAGIRSCRGIFTSTLRSSLREQAGRQIKREWRCSPQPRLRFLPCPLTDSASNACTANSTYFGIVGKKPRSYRVMVFRAMPSLAASSCCVRPRRSR